MYWLHMSSYGWINICLLGLGWNLNKKLKEELSRICFSEKSYSVRTFEVYVFAHSHYNEIFLDETRHLGLSNHINYKVIGSEMRELWIFEVNP